MAGQSYRVLHIEDDPADIVVVSRLLGRVQNFDVELIAKQTPEAGLAELAENGAHCVLLDYRLGATDGLSVLSSIREAYPSIPVVFVTGEGNEYVAIEAMRRGAQGYQVKSSLTSKSLKQAIESAMKIAEQERLLEDQRQELVEFVSVVAHDLQQPLCAVKGNIELIRDFYGANLDASGREFVDTAVRMTVRMSQMIESLLSYARAGRAQTQRQPVDLNRVMDNVLTSLSELIRQRSAEVLVNPLPLAMGDEPALTQLLQNLVANAIKFCEQRPRVEVTGALEESECVIQVHDNGIGVPSDKTSMIFEPFQRLHSRKRFEGSGIGLATCRRIVKKHGGRIGVESTPGEGSMFWFAIPARKKSASRQPRILIADGEPGLASSIESALRREGYETVTVGTTNDAARILDGEPVDLVIADVNLAGDSGADLIRGLRRRPSSPPVLALSGGSAMESPGVVLARARDAGAEGVLPLQFPQERLLEIVNELLRARDPGPESTDSATDSTAEEARGAAAEAASRAV